MGLDLSPARRDRPTTAARNHSARVLPSTSSSSRCHRAWTLSTFAEANICCASRLSAATWVNEPSNAVGSLRSAPDV